MFSLKSAQLIIGFYLFIYLFLEIMCYQEEKDKQFSNTL